MATLKEPFALDRSLNTTEVTPRNIADVLAEGLSHITGRTASEVEYDNTDSGLTADNVQDALDEIVEDIPTVPSVDIQTAVDEFSTYNGGLLSECKVALSPNQDLHGYENPWVGGSRKNKVPFFTSSTVSGRVWTVSDDGIVTITGTSTGNSYKVMNITLPAGTYQLSGGDPNGTSGTGDEYVQVDGAVVARSYGNTNQTFTLSEEKTVTLALRDFQTAGNSDTHVFKPMICLTSAVEPLVYEPYSNICPISGHTQVEVGDDGKNCLPNDATDQTVSGVAFKKNNNGSLTLNGQSTADWTGITLTSAKFLKAGTYTVSCPRVNSVDTRLIISYDGAEKVNTYNVDYKTFTLTEDKIISVRFVIRNSGVSFSNVTYYPMIELGSTATAYEPYNGYQVTVNLGGTYYGGYIDLVSGELVIDRVSVKIKDLTWTTQGGNYGRFLVYNSLALCVDTEITVWSDIYESYSNSGTDAKPPLVNGIYATESSNAIKVYDTDYPNTTDLSDWLTARGDNQIVYKLATPTSIQLSPTMVKALVGENHLSTPLEGQEITESKYKQTFTFDDVIAYIQSLS